MSDQLSFGAEYSSEVERLEAHLRASWPAIAQARQAAREQGELLTRELSPFVLEDTSLVVFGSLARRELTQGSDLDWTLLVDGQADPQHHDSMRRIRRRLVDLKVIEPGSTGTFGGLTNSHDLIHKIGGLDDTNVNLTQRNLLLLESVPIGSDAAYERVVRNVLRRYVEEDSRTAEVRYRVPRFLLNDIARYWRTLAVDFAQKRRDREGDKWALRVAKLRMSRKLIFTAGLMICYSCQIRLANEVDEPRGFAVLRIVEHLESLVRKTPLDIIAGMILEFPDSLGGPGQIFFEAYDGFLDVLDDPERRQRLENLSIAAAATDEIYLHVRELSEVFQEALSTLFFDSVATPFPLLTRKYGVF